MRLIEVDEAYKVLTDYYHHRTEIQHEALKEALSKVPTVAAIKHGHWLFYEEPDGYYHSECSECGQWCDEDVFLKGKWHYCPNCGARMDEVER